MSMEKDREEKGVIRYIPAHIRKLWGDISVDDVFRWVVSVDRRLISMRAIQRSTIIAASDVAHDTGRSIQNISRALKELEREGLVECLTPEKHSWRKYMLTEKGHRILDVLERKNVPHAVWGWDLKNA